MKDPFVILSQSPPIWYGIKRQSVLQSINNRTVFRKNDNTQELTGSL